MEQKFVAGGFLYNPETRQVLLHKRDANTPYNPNQWRIFGGQAEPGETPLETFVREMGEELSIAINQAAVKPLTDGFVTERGHHRYVFWAPSTLEKGEMKLTEGADFGWFSFDDAFKLDLTGRSRADLMKFKETVTL